MPELPSKCPMCGAHYTTGEDCRARFHRCLAKEFENPGAYGTVHHLTVVSYKLQHNEYSRRGWLEARELLSQFVAHELTPATARKRNRHRLDSGQRSWRVTEGQKMAGVENISWTRTIADVRLDNAELYRADVRRWAAHVLADTKHLAP